MATTWTATNRRDALVVVTPPVITLALGKDAGKNTYSGAFRAVRCTLTAAGTYTTGGDSFPDVGIKHIEAVLWLTDAAPAANPGIPRVTQPVSGAAKIQLYALAGTELAAAAATVGSYEVLVLGRSG